MDNVKDPTSDKRFSQLDSLRGIACFSVVLLHFHDAWSPRTLPHWKARLVWLLSPFYTGTEAVILFFVLSGFVLSLPYLRNKQQAYPQYLLRRVIRIYGPYLAALILAVAGASIWHHPAYSGWNGSHWADPFTWGLVAQHIAFVGVYDWRRYDFVVWPLIQEMRVSILFPLLVHFILRLRSVFALLTGLLLSLIAFPLVGFSSDITARYSFGSLLHYTAFFIIGILLASNMSTISRWWSSIPLPAQWMVAVVSILTYVFDDRFGTIGTKVAFHLHMPVMSVFERLALTNWAAAVGAAGFIIIALNSRSASTVLTLAPIRFLGRVSYSLYLVHPIVLMATTFTLGARVSLWLQFPLYLAASLFLSWIFWTVVESACTNWSRKVSDSTAPPQELRSAA